MCTQKLAKDSNGFQPDLCSNSPFEKQLSATKKTMENSCNIQTDRILNGGILSLSVGFSTKFPHSSRMVSTTQNQKMDILHTHTKKSLVSTQQKHIHTANVKIAAYIYNICTYISSYLCLKIEMKSTTHSRKKRNTTSTNSNPNVATKSNSKKKNKNQTSSNIQTPKSNLTHRNIDQNRSPQSNRFIPKGTKEPMLWLN